MSKWDAVCWWIFVVWISLAALCWAIGVTGAFVFGSHDLLLLRAAVLCLAGLIFSLFGVAIAYAVSKAIRWKRG